MPPLLDFDELLLKVRSPAAQAHIADAVAAFRAGALRPAVVSTWSAVVFDIMAKIREIELTGDPRATRQVERFDRIRDTNDVVGSLQLERTILDVARNEFELLTPHEYTDLVRLREDRHRCAHPAMNSADEAYQPSAELVRYHIGSALTHLLIQAPVQGKAALSRLTTEVSSPLFPTDVAGATRVLRGGPLQRPKEVLVRDFLIGTIKATLRGELADDRPFGDRAFAAVAATRAIHPGVANRVLSNDLPRVFDGLQDDEVWRLLRLGGAVPAVWEHIPTAAHAKLERLMDVMNVREWPELYLNATSVDGLRARAEARAQRFDRDDIHALFRFDGAAAARERPVVERAVELLVTSPSWNSTNSLIASVFLPNAGMVTESDLERIAEAAANNVEVRNANGTPGLLEAIRGAGTVPVDRFVDMIFRRNLGERFSNALEELPPNLLAAARGTATTFAIGSRVRIPEHGEGEVTEVTGTGDDIIVKVAFEAGPLWGPVHHRFARALTRIDAEDSPAAG